MQDTDLMEESKPVAALEAPKKAEAKIEVRDGLLLGETFEAEWRIAQVLIASGMVPKSLDTPAKVIAGRQYAKELGLPVVSGLRQIAVINGQPSIWGDLPLALCFRSGELAWIDEQFITEDFEKISLANKNLKVDPWGSVCRAKRKNGTEVERFFTIEDAKRAGLLDKPGPWKQYRRRMLQLKARGLALKDLMPDVLQGISIAEYDFDVLPSGEGNQMRDAEPLSGSQSRLLTQSSEVSK